MFASKISFRLQKHMSNLSKNQRKGRPIEWVRSIKLHVTAERRPTGGSEFATTGDCSLMTPRPAAGVLALARDLRYGTGARFPSFRGVRR